jgi:alanine-synthesizing transaminase
LNGPQDIIDFNRALYKGRRDVMVECFGRAGWDIPVPMASMFAWAPIPEPFRHLGSMEFAKRLLTQAGVAVAPGVGFGEEGEGFVRLALVENEQRLRQAARGVKKMIAAA